MKRILIAGAMAATLLLTSCSSNKDPYEAYRSLTATQIFTAAEHSMAKENWDDAIHQLNGVQAVHPFSKYSQQVSLNLIYVYYQDDKPDLAYVEANRYIRLYPRSKNVDYVYYMKGVLGFNQGLTWLQKVWGVDPTRRDVTGLRAAYVDFQQLVHNFPHSKYRNDALRRMAYIRNAMAARAVRVGQYYFSQNAYVAAANRANEVIQHYQGAPSVDDAFKLAVKSYQALGMKKQVQKYQAIMKANGYK